MIWQEEKRRWEEEGEMFTTREGCAVCVCVCVAYLTIQIVPFALTIISLLEKNTFKPST